MFSTEFVSECMAGDEGAIHSLVRTHQRGVYQLALSILDRGQAPLDMALRQAEIATRESFANAVAQIGRYRPDMLFENWLFTITIDAALRRAAIWRRERFFRRLFGLDKGLNSGFYAEPAAQVNSVSDAARSNSDEQIWWAICGLKDSLRLPVILRYYHDIPVDRIARILRMSEGAVHARLDQAREKLVAVGSSQGVT